MIPHPLLELSTKPLRNTRASQELRAYVSQEWRSEVAWLSHLPSRTPLLAQARSWLGRRKRAREPSPAAPAGGRPSGSRTVPSAPETQEPCPHLLTEALGFGGATEFLRCCLCGDVVIVQAAQRWSLGPAASQPSGEVPPR